MIFLTTIRQKKHVKIALLSSHKTIRSTMNNPDGIREMVGDILENVLDIVDTKIDDMEIDKTSQNRKTKAGLSTYPI